MVRVVKGNSTLWSVVSAGDRLTSLRLRGVGLALTLIALIPAPAHAHDGTGLAGGFAAGFVHPLSGADHMLAMISVGLWGAFLGRPLVAALPMLFPGMMVVGGALGMLAVPFPPVEIGVAVSVVVLGAMVLGAMRASVGVACAIVALFALFHGYAHGSELPAAADPIGYSAGFVLSTGLLHVAGIALGALRTVRFGTLGLRTGGGAIALAGLWFLATAVSR